MLEFFISDSIKIAILLVVIIFAVSFLRSYLPQEKVKKILSNRFEIVGNIMAVTALPLPEMIILRKVLKPKLLATYIAILTVGIIFTGYLFNWVM